MPTPTITRNVLRNRRAELSADERELLESAAERTSEFPAGDVVVRQNVPVHVSTLLVRDS